MHVNFHGTFPTINIVMKHTLTHVLDIQLTDRYIYCRLTTRPLWNNDRKLVLSYYVVGQIHVCPLVI